MSRELGHEREQITAVYLGRRPRRRGGIRSEVDVDEVERSQPMVRDP